MEKLRAFEFFKDKILIEKHSANDISLPSLNDLDIYSIYYLAPKFYILAKLDKKISYSDRMVYIHDGTCIVGTFSPHSIRVDLIYVIKSEKDQANYLITIGVDSEKMKDNTIKKTTNLKIWDGDTDMLDFQNLSKH